MGTTTKVIVVVAIAAGLGYAVTVRTDLCRAIDLNGSLDAATDAMRQAGVTLT